MQQDYPCADASMPGSKQLILQLPPVTEEASANECFWDDGGEHEYGRCGCLSVECSWASPKAILTGSCHVTYSSLI